MPRTLLVDAVGSCIAIDLSGLDEGDEAAVRAAWGDAAADAAAAPIATVTPGGAGRAQMLSDLSQQVTLAAIEAARGRAWMLHAAGVATADGCVVVMVGPSGRGKTTASRALGAVYGYVSDETVAIDADGRVWPYRKPLSVIEDPEAPKTQLPPSALGLQPLPDAELRVAAVVLLDRDERHPEQPVVEVTDVGDAMSDLVSQTSFLHDQAAGLRFIAALAAATGGIRTVKYREATSLPAVIAELARPAAPIVLPPVITHRAAAAVDGAQGGVADARHAVADETQPASMDVTRGGVADAARGGVADDARRAVADETQPASVDGPRSDVAESRAGPAHEPRFSRVDVADEVALEDPDRAGILTVRADGRGYVTVLGGIAPAVWRAAHGATFAQLVDAAVAAYDEPEGSDAGAAVLVAVGQLLDAGLLTSDEPVYLRRKDVAWVDSGDRIVALPLSPGPDAQLAQPAALTGSAAVIWEWLEDPVTMTQLVARATEAAGMDAAAEVAGQVQAFVAGLVESRLVQAQ
ncbi:PqqD family protein [Microbacterium terregens]|uniref:PqqD family protein n=1 Tax=Microbacterium terregens TaxID=69363 RepID=A0ABV5T3R4_9MICO